MMWDAVAAGIAGLCAVGGVVWGSVNAWFSLRSKADTTARDVHDIKEHDLREVREQLKRIDDDIRQMPERYVPQTHLDRLEGRISQRMDQLEASMREMLSAVIKELTARRQADQI